MRDRGSTPSRLTVSSMARICYSPRTQSRITSRAKAPIYDGLKSAEPDPPNRCSTRRCNGPDLPHLCHRLIPVFCSNANSRPDTYESNRAFQTAELYVCEFDEPFNPGATDWDTARWSDRCRTELANLTPDEIRESWSIYQLTSSRKPTTYAFYDASSYVDGDYWQDCQDFAQSPMQLFAKGFSDSW